MRIVSIEQQYLLSPSHVLSSSRSLRVSTFLPSVEVSEEGEVKGLCEVVEERVQNHAIMEENIQCEETVTQQRELK